MINLKKFYSDDDTRERLKNPHSRGEYTYATNGHILIRVPRRSDVPENDQAPNCEGLFNEAEKREYVWAPIPPDVPPVVREIIDCDMCDGKGREYFDDEGRYKTCDECSGSGKLESVKTVGVEFKLGEKTIFLDNRYVLLIAELPNAEIGLTELAAVPSNISRWDAAPVKFRFDDGNGLRGDGLLMPRRS